MNNDLMLVIEDQWRKQLHEEQRQEEEDRRKEEAARVEGIVTKEGIEGRRSRLEATAERVGTGTERGARDVRSSGQLLVLDE